MRKELIGHKVRGSNSSFYVCVLIIQIGVLGEKQLVQAYMFSYAKET